VSGAGALILAFATVPIAEDAVARFVELTPYPMTLMATFDSGRLVELTPTARYI
jgi:hypothetical protein